MAAKLKEYNQKRNFANTDEPIGRVEGPEDHLRYVIQHHMARREHYDLRLEWNGVLLSWAVPKGPSYDPRDKRLAVQVEDHPLEYRHFEGTIPKGEYGGGVVMLWDEGLWEPYGNVDEGLKNGSLKFRLNGKRLNGKWALVRLKPKAGEKKDNWLLLKEKDEFAKTDDGISNFDTSIRTGRTMEEIKAGTESKIIKNPFVLTNVQLAKQVKSIPEGDDWLYELKFDGYRILAYLEGNNVRLVSRNGNDYTKRFHDVAYSLINWAAGRSMVLDGEMVVTDARGKTDFQALQNYLKSPRGKKLSYIIFDLLALNGEDLRGKRLIERKEKKSLNP
jgi:bifunctional non-homologous end joining protein LigD